MKITVLAHRYWPMITTDGPERMEAIMEAADLIIKNINIEMQPEGRRDLQGARQTAYHRAMSKGKAFSEEIARLNYGRPILKPDWMAAFMTKPEEAKPK